MAGYGTGAPLVHKCAVLRRVNWRDQPAAAHLHEIELTGEMRRNRGRRGPRSGPVRIEYRCSCGHTGWSNHADLLYRAIRHGTFSIDQVRAVAGPSWARPEEKRFTS